MGIMGMGMGKIGIGKGIGDIKPPFLLNYGGVVKHFSPKIVGEIIPRISLQD